MGTLLEAGKGNLDSAGLRAFLEPGSARRGGPTAPAKGLFLIRVDYER
jgi:tRNA pseudouridine38-40 synthase